MRSIVAASLVALATIACRPDAATTPAGTTGADSAPAGPHQPFLAARAEHPTVLLTKGPTPETLGEPPTPAGAQAIRYPSATGELFGWLMTPQGDGPFPVLVYFHGGFALAPSDFAKVRPLVDAGWAVMTPSLRGENGNPGAMELLFGELDDAVSAVAWVASQPKIDPAQVHVIGHSAGGGLAALVSLRPDAKVASTSSIGGIYVPQTFVRWAKSEGNSKLIRFDPSLRHERELRVLGPNVTDMVHPHTAYVGSDDAPILENAEAVIEAAQAAKAPLDLVIVDGDHVGSIKPALDAWLAARQAQP
jgi:acetyl esterase/lipase